MLVWYLAPGHQLEQYSLIPSYSDMTINQITLYMLNCSGKYKSIFLPYFSKHSDKLKSFVVMTVITCATHIFIAKMRTCVHFSDKVVHCNSLQWRHNGPDGVSNHQPHHCLLSRLSGRRSKKTSKLRVTGLCAGNSPGTGGFPAQMTRNTENISIWWYRHDICLIHCGVCEMSLFVPHCPHHGCWWIGHARSQDIYSRLPNSSGLSRPHFLTC